MKKLIAILGAVLALSMANADEIQTLTTSNSTYRATIKADNTVFYNVVGKGVPCRTNLLGWNNLKTNLLSQGYILTNTTSITSKVVPLVLPGNMIYNQSQREQEARGFYEAAVAEAEKNRREMAAKALHNKLLHDPKAREAATAAYELKIADEKVSQGVEYIKSGREVRQ